MTARGSPPLLTFELGMEMFQRMYPICDRRADIFSNLRRAGFSAFDPRLALETSFCKCDEDARIHERAENELNKRLLSNASIPLPGTPGQIKYRYCPPFIEGLKRQRDEANGCSESEIEQRFPYEERWARRQYDPCLRHNTMGHQEWLAFFAEEQKYIEAEAKLHSSGMGQGRDVSRDDRCDFIIDAALKYGDKLGFVHTKSKSAKRKPTVWKSLTEMWDLRWVVPSTSDFMFSPFVDRNKPLDHMALDPELVLCASHVRADIEKAGKPGEFLSIQYQLLARPFMYRRFWDYDELELVVKSHFTLLAFVLDEIEDAIRPTLDILAKPG